MKIGQRARVSADMTCCQQPCTGKHGRLERSGDSEYDFSMLFDDGVYMKRCIFNEDELEPWDDHI